MNKGEVRNAILDELEKLLGPVGFRVKRKNAELIRKTSSGYQRVTFALYDYNPIFEFSILVILHFNEMEELFLKAVAHEWPHAANGPIWEIGIRRSYFFDGLANKLSVTSAEEIESAVNKLRPGIIDKMIPFFRQSESLAGYEGMINAESDRYTEIRPPYDAYLYIMASYLANRDRFDEVVKKWGTLPDTPVIQESDRENMRKLLAYLNGSPT